MRVRFQVSGGIAYFPGLSGPKTIDVDRLDDRTRETLTTLIRGVDFFALPSQLAGSQRAADHHTYHITVEDGERAHTVSVSDPLPTELLPLIEVLRTL